MQIRFLGAAQTVTGACFVIEKGATRVMVDCGMFRGVRPVRDRNCEDFAVWPQSVDCVLLTHAHIDHSGMLPKLVKHGFKGKIYATGATIDLCSVLLPDSGHIQEAEVERMNRKRARSGQQLLKPFYTPGDAYECLNHFQQVDYGKDFSLAPGISARFLDAGHILGSAIIEITVRSEGETSGDIKIVFTGDLGTNHHKYFTNEPATVWEADYLVLESTYGDRLHRNSEDRLQLLRDAAWDTFRKRGNLVIPAFAVERAQDLIYDLNRLVIENQLPPMRIYLDSPMAVASTEVFKKHPECFDEKTKDLIRKGKNPLEMAGLHFAVTADESRAINEVKEGAIIISASGMCDAGRIKHHLKHNLWRPECTILFVGYQAPGTKGHRILNGAETIRVHGEDVAVRAEIRSIDGFSAHADYKEILEWVGKFKKLPRKIFLVHGEPEAIDNLAGLLENEFNVQTYSPAWKETVSLLPGKQISEQQIRKMYDDVVAKLDGVLQEGMDQPLFPAVLRRLTELDGLLNAMKKEKV